MPDLIDALLAVAAPSPAGGARRYPENPATAGAACAGPAWAPATAEAPTVGQIDGCGIWHRVPRVRDFAAQVNPCA